MSKKTLRIRATKARKDNENAKYKEENKNDHTTVTVNTKVIKYPA